MPHVYRKALTNNHRGQRVAIHFVHAPLRDKITPDAEYDQKVHANKKEVMVEHKIKAASGASMSPQVAANTEFGPFPPIDGPRNDHAKSDHVVERDRQKNVRVAQMELNRVKPRHDNGDGDAQRHHQRGQPGSKPS